ncbi:MAG: DUF192 domain-containing protein [Myxococcota bacterium]|nr:DUF192 domain-containing protein [Myxococcota bacterium]
MRSFVLILVACATACAACSNGSKRDDAAMPAPEKPAAGPAPTVHLETPRGEVAVTVEIVATQPKIEKGMMFREHLAPDAGMLFFMSREHEWSFYMRNTLIPLDMIFIAKDMTVAGIVHKAEPRTETLRKVGKPSLYVLEVNGGWSEAHQVAPGAKVRFEHMPPGLPTP